MRNAIGYMLTWTTYGTWLQGDTRGYVKDGDVRGENAGLERSNRRSQRGKTVRLTKSDKDIVREAILREAAERGHDVQAIMVCSNHVHVVVVGDGRCATAVAAQYKGAATKALRVIGYDRCVWGRGYDKRYCFDEKAMDARVAYVIGHGD